MSITEKALHNNASVAVVDYTTQFTDAIVLQSKTLATIEGTDEVQKVHVEKAREIVLSLSRKKDKLTTFLQTLGALLLGIGLQGMYAEWSTATPRPNWIIGNAIASIIGIAILMVGILRK